MTTDPDMPPIRPMEVPDEAPTDIASQVRAAAGRRPDRLALIDGAQRLTAAEMVDRMDRCASALRDAGLARGDVLATLAGTTADHVVLYLGAAALGVAVAPLPVSAHPDAIARMLDNCAPALVLGDGSGPDLPGVRDLAAVVAGSRAHPPMPAQAFPPDLLFDIIYSSGTTGAPKGIEHDIRFRDRQVQRFIRFGLTEDAVALFSTPLCSNTTLATLIPALALGATVALMGRFDAAGFLALSQDLGVTHAMMVPVQIRRIIEHPDFDRYDLRAFQVKLSTSAPLPPDVVRQVLARWPGRMVNIYGMTEGGVSAVLDCSAHPDKLHTIGRVAANAEIRLIDEAGLEVPPGQPGEIVGRSTTVMRGYRAAPDATRDAVWISPEGDTYIRSGDMGRCDDQGFITLLDRRRDMIISGGFNIFAADIEAVLARHPALHEVAVIGVPSPRWGETPVACVTLRAGADLSADALMDWANARLGKTQRLAAVWPMADLPRNAIGKILKRDLRASWVARQDEASHA
ncbi:MAG: class I adenylate-forming enzyme family protein [Paracoccus sp. (in: a-proteobacteria)]|uniref:class I adenylate-forming enzyme family protein n=1 Tax=Paracoccus sp. TaxID=267 RepID=UPI003918D33B